MKEFVALDLIVALKGDPELEAMLGRAKAVKVELSTDIIKVWTTDIKFWEVRKDRNKNLYCTCPAWKFSKKDPKTCKHIMAVTALCDISKLPVHGSTGSVDWWKS